jgi:methylated-DNA-[protein]-cysteine S-methyltransferase
MPDHHCELQSPIGTLRLCANERGLTGLYFAEHRRAPAMPELARTSHPLLDAAVRQLEEYFGGARAQFDLSLAPTGTPFQLAVWNALRAIPYGVTISYSELAHRLGNPAAVRAVGAANARNPLSIFIPCHRVIGASGALTGYAGGQERKRWLLAHEKAQRLHLGDALPVGGPDGALGSRGVRTGTPAL